MNSNYPEAIQEMNCSHKKKKDYYFSLLGEKKNSNFLWVGKNDFRLEGKSKIRRKKNLTQCVQRQNCGI